MTGVMAMFFSGGGFTAVQGVARSSSEIGPANVFTPQIQFVNDGSALFKNNAGSNVADTNWGNPITVGIGSFYWVRFTNSSGAGVYNGVGVGATWNSITAGVSLGINAAGGGASVARTGTFDIASDAAGVNIVASGTFSFLSDRT